MDRIDREELERCDGVDGARALVAHEGNVYDVSNSKLWRNGQHVKTHQAGSDLTAAVAAAPHGTDVFERVELVGELADADEVPQVSEFPTPPPFIAALLDRHPHPISVHFPIALSITAALFLLLGLVSASPFIERAAFYNLCVAALATPAAIVAGLLSWRYNYGQILTPTFRNKLILSGVLTVLLGGVLLMRACAPEAAASAGPLSYLYTAVVLLLAPTVMLLGYYGGKITFP